jgi:hypothetical protein
MILRIASNGTAKIAPGTPHIQNQNTSDKMTRIGFTLKEVDSEVERRRQQSPATAKGAAHPKRRASRDADRAEIVRGVGFFRAGIRSRV